MSHQHNVRITLYQLHIKCIFTYIALWVIISFSTTSFLRIVPILLPIFTSPCPSSLLMESSSRHGTENTVIPKSINQTWFSFPCWHTLHSHSISSIHIHNEPSSLDVICDAVAIPDPADRASIGSKHNISKQFRSCTYNSNAENPYTNILVHTC